MCFSLAITVGASEKYTVKAKYTYYAPETVSLAEAKQIALNRAKIEAINDKFGSVVSQTNTSMIKTVNGETQTNFTSYGDSKIKGEWIETLTEPEYKIEMIDGFTVVSVTVKGIIRETSGSKVDVEAKILRNGIEIGNESSEFLNGNEMYLWFKSPVDGYLAVYLVDDSNAYCLLPYRNQNQSVFKILADEKYTFFSKKYHNKAIDARMIDEYVLQTADDVETNFIYIVFSPNRFVKSIDSEGDYNIPRSLSIKEFQKWLDKVNSADSELTIQKKAITIHS